MSQGKFVVNNPFPCGFILKFPQQAEQDQSILSEDIINEFCYSTIAL